MTFDFSGRNRFFLFLAPTHGDLWRRRGRLLDRIVTLLPTDADYAAQLKQALVNNRAHRIGLLLNLPDLTVQSELTPAVGMLDRRKLVARRLDYLFPRAVLKGAKIGKVRTQLAALRAHPVLTTTLQAIVSTSAELDWIAHTALEAARIIPATLQTTPYICVIKLGDSALLLAGESWQLQAARHLPLPQLDEAPLAAEVQSTFAYLQRHGWQQTRDLAFIGFGVEQPAVPNLHFTRAITYPEASGYAELLAQLVHAGKPLQPLTQPRLQRRKRLHRIQHALTYASITAAILTMLCFAACYNLFGALATQDHAITSAMAALPPPLAIQNLSLLKRLQHALDAPLTLSAALPNDDIKRLSYQSAALEGEESYALHLTATAAPALADWQLSSQPNAIPISGTIGKALKIQPDSYSYTFQVQP